MKPLRQGAALFPASALRNDAGMQHRSPEQFCGNPVSR